MIPAGLTPRETGVYLAELKSNPKGGVTGAMRAVELDRTARLIRPTQGHPAVMPANLVQLGAAALAKACAVCECKVGDFHRKHYPEAIRARRWALCCLRPVIGRIAAARALALTPDGSDVMFRDCPPNDRAAALTFGKALDVQWPEES